MIAATNNRVSYFFGRGKSGRFTSAFLFCVLVVFLTACFRTKPKPEECADAQIHIVKLIADDESMPKQVQALMLRSILKPEMNEAIVNHCIQHKTLKQVQCEQNATKFSELNVCKKYGTPEEPPPAGKVSGA
ncbi:LipL41-expression chaperone Lep [Leptospira fletcheri]|uniref:LipL41-expression chaperone Lep n=1 Tax=Leptospira fletcheri TaxID=2484981 RepID=A0A4R9GJ42_9LEPT|nr:LipL41-expression chaperone Lep [Leptospira fletcheri]TGK12176.1 LipL41-expression chaperone Lep [Leptospira fletcheri]